VPHRPHRGRAAPGPWGGPPTAEGAPTTTAPAASLHVPGGRCSVRRPPPRRAPPRPRAARSARSAGAAGHAVGRRGGGRRARGRRRRRRHGERGARGGARRPRGGRGCAGGGGGASPRKKNGRAAGDGRSAVRWTPQPAPFEILKGRRPTPARPLRGLAHRPRDYFTTVILTKNRGRDINEGLGHIHAHFLEESSFKRSYTTIFGI